MLPFYFMCNFLSVRYFELFVIHKIGELDILKTKKQ